MGKKLMAMFLVLAIGITLLPGVTVLTHATDSSVLDGATTMSAWAEGNFADLATKVLTINNEEDFEVFQDALSQKNKTFAGYTVCLTADIDMNPHWNSTVNLQWDETGALTTDSVQVATGVGADGYVLPGTNSTGKIFNGTFDGMGHSISGLYLSQNGANVASLFGKTTGASTVVKNLAVLDSFFLNGKTDSPATNGDNVKPLAGLFTIVESGASATITNCYIDVDLYDGQPTFSSSAAGFNAKTGGLVGYCVGSVTIKDTVYAGSISNNLSTKTKYSNAEKDAKEKWRYGGAVGQLKGTSETARASVTMENYVFNGAIYHEDKGASGGIGFCNSFADVNITKSLNMGPLHAKSEKAGFIGCLNASSTDTVRLEDCYTNQSIANGLTDRLIVRANTQTCTISVKHNGVELFDLEGKDTTTNPYAINPDLCRVYFGKTSGVYSFSKGVNSAMDRTAYGGDAGVLSDIFTPADNTLVPKALYELFKATAPVISTDPVGAAYDKEVGAAALTVAATGEGTLSYQWYLNGKIIEGATAATYTPATAEAGNYTYTCKVTVPKAGMTGMGASVVSQAAIIHVHDWNPGTCTSPKTCNTPECPTIVEAVDHAFDGDCTTADKCANCDEVATANEKHTFDTDCTTADKCANCETKATANEAHTYTDNHDIDCNTDGCSVTREAIHTESAEWTNDETKHWHVCTGCDEVLAAAMHTDTKDDEDVLCDVCGYDMTCKHTERTKIEGVAATCTQDGIATHWKCNKCGVLLDAEVEGNVIEKIATVIPAWHSGVSKKYSSNDTNHWKVCSACKAKLYVSAHTYSSATDTKCDCGHKRELVSLDSVITVTQWVKDGKSADVKAVKITNVADFKAFMKELVGGTTAVLNTSYAIRTEGDVAFDGMTIYLAADLDLNAGWTNEFELKWSSTGKLKGKTAVTVPTNKYNPTGQRIFGGMLDGQGHTISGLFIDKQKNAAAQSLLGVAHSNSDFTVGVQNLKIKNSYIEGTNPGMGSLFTGVTAGTNVLISNCSVDVDLVSRYAGADKSSIMVGGLIGAAAGNVTIDSTTYSGSIWAENTGKLEYREVGGAIGAVKGGSKASEETNIMLNEFKFNGKIYWLNGQRIGLFVGRIDNQTSVSFVDSTSKGKLVLMSGMYAGGLCNSIVSATAGTKTNVVIDNCYYVPGQICNEGVLVDQNLIFNVMHSGATSTPYGGFGRISTNTSAKGNSVVYVISDRGTDWSENLCLYLTVPSPDTGDIAGMSLGFVAAMMLFSAMAIVVLLPKKFGKK